MQRLYLIARVITRRRKVARHTHRGNSVCVERGWLYRVRCGTVDVNKLLILLLANHRLELIDKAGKDIRRLLDGLRCRHIDTRVAQ